MTNSSRTALTTLRWLARALALAAAYFVVAKIGLRYATIGPSISPVWPPTGLAVAALALLGPRYWPAILLGAFLANATTSIPVLAAAGLACGNASEATVAADLLRRRAGQHLALDDLLGVRTLVGVAAPVGALASAAVGVTSLWLAHVVSGAAVWSALSLWWAGDYLGALVVAPVFLTWLGPAGLRIGRRTALELALLVGGAVLATMAIFGSLLPASLLPQAEYPYLLFPFVIGAALRFGPRGAARRRLHRAGRRSLRHADRAEHHHRAHALRRHPRHHRTIPGPCHGPSRAGGTCPARRQRASCGRDPKLAAGDLHARPDEHGPDVESGGRGAVRVAGGGGHWPAAADGRPGYGGPSAHARPRVAGRSGAGGGGDPTQERRGVDKHQSLRCSAP